MMADRFPSDCPICGCSFQDSLYLRLSKNNLQSKRCINCEAVFVINSPINVENASNFYTMDAYKGSRELQDTDLYSGYYDNCFVDYDVNNETIKQFINIINNIRCLVPVKERNIRILDVGCATGVFLDIARKLNFDVTGVEISKELAEYARANFKISVFDNLGSISEENYFDVITLNDVIEHIPSAQLNSMMTKLTQLLAPNGYIVIRTPIENSLLRTLAKVIYYFSFRRSEYLLHLFYSYEHLINFSDKSLRLLGSKIGLSVALITREEEDPERLNIGLIAKLILRVLYLLAKPFSLQHKAIYFYKLK